MLDKASADWLAKLDLAADLVQISQLFVPDESGRLLQALLLAVAALPPAAQAAAAEDRKDRIDLPGVAPAVSRVLERLFPLHYYESWKNTPSVALPRLDKDAPPLRLGFDIISARTHCCAQPACRSLSLPPWSSTSTPRCSTKNWLCASWWISPTPTVSAIPGSELRCRCG